MQTEGRPCWPRSKATARARSRRGFQSAKPVTVKLYITGEIDPVSRLFTMRQACGTKLTIEQSAATEPVSVIQFIVIFDPPRKRNEAAVETPSHAPARAAATIRSPTSPAFAANPPKCGTIRPIRNSFASSEGRSDAVWRFVGVLDLLGPRVQCGAGARDQSLERCCRLLGRHAWARFIPTFRRR